MIRFDDTRPVLLLACAFGALVLGTSALAGAAIPCAALVVIPVLAVAWLDPKGVAIAAAGALGLALVGGLAAREFFEADHLTALVAVGGGGGVAMWLAVEGSKRSREREWQALLGEASSLLASSIDYETTVRAAAGLPVPCLADWCVLDLVQPDGGIQRRAVHHAEPEREEVAWRLGKGYEPSSRGGAEVLRTARAQLWPEIEDSLLVAVARDQQHLADLRALGTGSAMIVPLRTVDRTIGVMTLGSRAPRRFTPDDVEPAQDLARRSAIAIENAELYRNALRAAGGRFSRKGEMKSPITPSEGGAA